MTIEFSYRSKYTTVGRLLADRCGTLLDVGARNGVLRNVLPAALEYRSADIGAGCDFVIDLERVLRFEERSFDYVVALDVLEHVNNFHTAFHELQRIARRGVIIALPNMAFLPHRLSFALRGRLNTDKYDLPYEPVPDRHRWLMTCAAARRFMLTHAESGRFKLATIVNEAGGSRPWRLASWALMRSGLPLSDVLCDRTIFVFEATHPASLQRVGSLRLAQ